MTEEKKKPAKEEEAKPKAETPKKEEKPVKKAEPKKEAPKEEAKKDVPKEDAKKGEAQKGETKKDSKKEDEEEEKKIIKESVHTINLRKAYEHPRTSRIKYAAREIKDYIRKHTRKEPFVGPDVNEALWAKGIQSPPRKIRVKIQEEEKRATAVLV